MNTYTSIENWRIFISAVPMGHMHHLFSLNGLCAVTCSSAKLMMSLLSCWLHVKLFFSAVLNTHVSYFPVTSRTHTESTASYYWALQHWPLLFFCFFFNALWDSCSVVFRGNTEKPFSSYLSPHRMQKCCPQSHATCNPPFSALGPVSMEVPSSLSNIIFSLNLICIFLFFPEWAANDVLYYTAQKNLKCQNVFMTTFTYQKHTKLVYTEQDAR